MVGDGVQMPLIGRLAIERPCAFERDIVQVFAIDQRGLSASSYWLRIERGVDRRARLHIQPHSRAQMKLSRRVLPGRNVDPASARFAAGIDGFLQCWPGIVALAAGCAVVLDIEDALRSYRLTRWQPSPERMETKGLA